MPAAPKPGLFLIDGYALIYRAFFAMIGRPLRTGRGENTSAVWGVANFLHRLFDSHHPDFIAWVHDAGTSFRTEIYPDYKATREKLDDELQADFDRSLERIEALLAAFNVPLIVVDGYEADDVIGTLATRAGGTDTQIVIVSGDKDLYQLIAPNVALLNPGRRGPAALGPAPARPASRCMAVRRMRRPRRSVCAGRGPIGGSSRRLWLPQCLGPD